MDLDGLASALLVGSAIILIAIVGVRFAGRLGLPGLLLYLGMGLVLGELSPYLDLGDPMLATVLGSCALVIILAEGGLSTRVEDLRPVLWPAVALATIGVGLSIAVVAAPLIWLLQLDPTTAVLIGAVLAATDAAAVFSVLRGLHLHPRLRSLLEAEAGFNDAPVVVLVVVLSTSTVTAGNAWQIPLIVIAQLVGGVAVGLAVGFAAKWALPRLALPSVGLYPIAVMAILVGAYGLADVLRSSGFLATYIAGVVIGSTVRLPHRKSVVGFAEGLAWAAEIGLFVMLGLLADVHRVWDSLGTAVVAGVVLLLVARPLAALVSLAPFRIPAGWVAFVGVAGLRGAVPIVFAAIALGAGAAGAEVVFDTTLILVIVMTLLQTPLLPWSGRLLGVDLSGQANELSVESAPLDNMDASLLGVDVAPDSQLVGVHVAELRLPEGALVALIVRHGQGRVPSSDTRIRAGDRLMVVATEESRSAAEQRLRAVSRQGRLAGWRRQD